MAQNDGKENKNLDEILDDEDQESPEELDLDDEDEEDADDSEDGDDSDDAGSKSKLKKKLTPEQQIGILKRKNKKLERQLAGKTVKKTESTSDSLTLDEIEVLNKHGKDGLLMARKIAERDGTTVEEVVEGKEFENYMTTKKEEDRVKASGLGKSRGQKQVVKKTLATPGLTSQERKELMKAKGFFGG